jgi:hypothetical protein
MRQPSPRFTPPPVSLLPALLAALSAAPGCVCNPPPADHEDSGPLCMDGLDNDGDGFVDCDDQDCSIFTFCTGTCGDGVVDPGEECDNGAGNGMGTCSVGCTLVAQNCGNGTIDPGEQCDQGPMNSDTEPNRCRTDCQNPSCGDGVMDNGEECDDGAGNSDSVPDACRLDCVLPFCGDGVQDAGEGCDNGELNSDTAPGACRTNCEPYFCGDGVVDLGEGCDDGGLNGMPGQCSATCSPPGCGDGTYDPASEFCDAGDVGTHDCAEFGYLGGTLGCTAACSPDVAGCNNCGNALIDGTEDCDGAALGGATCMTVTGGPGTLGCNPDCTYDTSGCAGCGNGMIEGTEQCDGLNLGGNDCTTVPGGFSSGTLACDSSCMFDTTGCSGGACDVDAPPLYTVSPSILLSCALGTVDLSITSFTFSQSGAVLTASPMTATTGALDGPSTTCPSGSFSVSNMLPGACCETYTLAGSYVTADTWTGTFTAMYCDTGSCGCPGGTPGECDVLGIDPCVTTMWSVTGTR